MRRAKETLKHFQKIENEIMRNHTGKNKTKYQIISLFKEIKTLCLYRVPMMPLNKDGEFACPRCNSVFVLPDDCDISDYNACPNCGQVFHDLELEKENEQFRRYLKGDWNND